MMKKLFTMLLAAACFTASAQSDIDYPYNPDFENDGFVGIEDVLELLSVYGTPFTPEQLLLDGASLTEIIESLQSQIDSLASYTNEGFGAIALNDSLLTEYLVGIAAASEEGDSTLGAWVMQLSEVVEQQQAQIDSLSTVNLGLAFGATEHAKFHELEWTQQENAGNNFQTILSFENDVLFRLYGGNSWIKFVIIPNSVTLDLVANANLAEANFSESFWEGENPTITLALNSDEMLVMFANSGALEAETTTGEMNVYWTPLVQNSNEAGSESNEIEETHCFLNFGYTEIYSIPEGCEHVIVEPPSEVPFWEVRGYTSSGFTQFYNVPIGAVVDTILSTEMDVTEIIPFPTAMLINLNSSSFEEVIIECAAKFPWQDFVLPTLQMFESSLSGDDWISDDGVLGLPRIYPVDSTGFEGLIRFKSQNLDFSTSQGVEGDATNDWSSGSDQIGKYRRSFLGNWFEMWSGW